MRFIRFALLGMIGIAGGITPSTNAQTADPALAAAVMREVNAFRVREGLAALPSDPQLESWTGEWALRAAGERSLAHRKDLPARMRAHGWGYLNENMYSGSGPMPASRVVAAWMKSPGHRKNLLHPQLTVGACGIARNEQGETYAVFHGGVR
jgi:uncharacterized protein YkwD